MENKGQAADHEQVIDLRHVDLTAHIGVGVDDFETGQIAELHRLLSQ